MCCWRLLGEELGARRKKGSGRDIGRAPRRRIRPVEGSEAGLGSRRTAGCARAADALPAASGQHVSLEHGLGRQSRVPEKEMGTDPISAAVGIIGKACDQRSGQDTRTPSAVQQGHVCHSRRTEFEGAPSILQRLPCPCAACTAAAQQTRTRRPRGDRSAQERDPGERGGGPWATGSVILADWRAIFEYMYGEGRYVMPGMAVYGDE